MSERNNRLAGETSPYLLQHKTNPVDWYPWGGEALQRAAAEDKPIFLSIGYAACHWCHVMERESFENRQIAEFLNQHFVAIKVDREERPDVDEIYMAVTVALSGSGGWPMSVFLTPDQQPFFAGTYFPATDRYGRIGFDHLLRRIAQLWNEQRAAVLSQAKELTQHLQQNAGVEASLPIRSETIARVVEELSTSFDPEWGGFGTAPKFPPHQLLRLLLRHHLRSGDERALSMAKKTLDAMKNGGIYDQVGGGFARYSTDQRWLVPHFEKMLYDNAQLAVGYLEAFQVTADPEYQRVARETLDYVLREMQSPEGGYYSATDADSEGEEGKFFVFLPEELDEILGRDEAEAFCLYYDVSVQGNWEGKNVLNTPRSLPSVAKELGRDPDALATELAASREKVYRARSQRVPPLLDDKVLVAWNGLMIEAMAEGHRVLRDRRYLDSARRAARFLRERLSRPDGGLFRTARQGKSHIPGFLEDYSYLADALVSLYETSGEVEWLNEALRLAERMLSDFGDAGGGFFNTAKDAEKLIARVREGHDGALPNPNAVAARALARLGRHLDRQDLTSRAEGAITAYGKLVEKAPRAFPTALAVADFLQGTPIELVLVGDAESLRTEALAHAVARVYLPNRVVALSDPQRQNPTPLAQGKSLVADSPALYLCRNFACERPLTEPDAVSTALAAARVW